MFSTSSFAQRAQRSALFPNERHDVGVFAGVASYLGDFNETDLLYRANLLTGILYRYSVSPYFAIRGQAGYALIEGHSGDHYGDLPGFPSGGWMGFQRSMVMIDGVAEVNFLPYNPIDKKRRHIVAPYVALGLGVNFLGSNRVNNNPRLDLAANMFPEIYGEPGNKFPQSVVFEIPIGFGVKVSPIRRLTIAGEWTFKKMFYDDIDGFTNREGGSFSLINDDWVSTLTVSLTYRFASNWNCPAYNRRAVSTKPLTGFKDKMYNVNARRSAEKYARKGASAKNMEGRSANDNDRIKKNKKR